MKKQNNDIDYTKKAKKEDKWFLGIMLTIIIILIVLALS
jgi:t-SNARE complex subunit (syntaxin)